MKYLFRVGFILLPAALFLSTNAYPSDYSLVERDLNAPAANRSPSSDANQRIKLNALSPLVIQNTTESATNASVNELRELSPATPIFGSGIGVRVAVFYFK